MIKTTVLQLTVKNITIMNVKETHATAGSANYFV
jgi:hypothetical protein